MTRRGLTRKALVPRSGMELQDAAAKGLLLTQKELAAVFGCSTDTISRYTRIGMPCIYNGVIQRQARGARPRYRYPDCVRWLEGRKGGEA